MPVLRAAPYLSGKASRGWLPLAIGVALLAGCATTDSGPLRLLSTDPLAHLALEGGDLLRRSEQDAGRALGKPRRAQILQTFVPKPGVSLSELQSEAEARATAAGWVLQPSDEGVRAHRQHDGLTVTLAIYPQHAGEPRLVVALMQE
ncbi:MAG: hypothetical protein KJ066_02820 [Acidobacteria bacterium]|nr:hypothetical protein [Acidobacteriota bacterium]